MLKIKDNVNLKELEKFGFKEEQVILEVKFNNKLQSIFLNDWRVGGCKWNDVDGGQYLKLYLNKKDLLERVAILDKERANKIKKYENALRKACEIIYELNDYCGNCSLESEDKCDQDCIRWRVKYFLEEAEKEMEENETNNQK
ncbi:hypothetical protein [uncultured Clostridium sp.]|uniref:hypothetical protein n=1 Tax=uncultured Clostridium sp. TaxID=59620 RepID=UPI002601C4B5|nr:hypothetical protein [uncultured Clostridium sp.]